MKSGVLAVASSGGHWQQLLLLSESLQDLPVTFVTTKRELLKQSEKTDGFVVYDCNRDKPLQVAKCLIQCARIVFTLRPKVIISTGAAPGLICIALGKFVGAKSIWVDSFANVEQLSMSGKMARYICDHWVTQWEHLSRSRGPIFEGALL
ncbi:UDP-N-acetylglucosamine:LPS N-acetylglucosamine transferase [Rhizobium sp. BK650]|uniref:glucuronosyltransferase n=1 Tax=Rhizobium sp. BK650 TaxID=2586990 RepID=UPI00161C840B|nr:UDP-N-acetylglucosamine:LPS N-acetylglucosamine transferase [Rhizobium sp. BK650]